MRTRGFSHLLIAIVSGLCLGNGPIWSLPQSTPGRKELPNSTCLGAPLGTVEFPGINASDYPMLRELTGLRDGQVLDRESLQRALRVLFATGRFTNLSAECDRSPEGKATLSFVGEPTSFIGRVSVENLSTRPTESQVVNASKLQLGEELTAEKMDRAERNIEQLMRENGFYNATVSHSEQVSPDTQQVEVTFRVIPGAAARVGKVTVAGDSLFSRGQVEDIGHLRPGDTLTSQTGLNAIDRIRKKLQKKNRWLALVEIFDRSYRAESNTVDFTLNINAGPVVHIGVQGYRLNRSTIRRSVPVYEENALDDDLLNEGRRNILSYMESRGYFEANVELKRQSDPAHNVVNVIYQIDPGEKHKVVKVELQGNKTLPDEALRPAMQVQEASLLLRHGRYSEALLRSDTRVIENQYRNNGFAQVKVSSRVEDDYHGKKNQIAVFIHVDEGLQTLVGKLEITGNTTQPSDSFPPLNTQTGQPFSDANIAQDRDILLNYYFNNGFLNATFEATATPAPDHRMDVVFHLQEGDRVYVGRVLVSGREFTRSHVVNRELQMKPGDPLSQGSLLDTQQKLYDLGIFSQVDTAVQNPEGVESKKNVLVQLQEAKRYTFNYGLGFEFQTGQPGGSASATGSNGVSPLVSFDVTRLNFRGRNHTITFQSRVGRLQQRGLISYEAPHWFNNPNWKLTFTGYFDHTLDVATFTSQRLEGTVQAGQIINKSSTIDYRLNYRLVKAIHPRIALNQIPQLSQPVRLGEPAIAYIRNRRDNDLETTRGTYITADAGVANRYFGSEADFSRILIQDSTYHPFGKKRSSGRELVFARSTRVGVENPFGNTVITEPGVTPSANLTQIPLPERFFMGGGNSHRGFGLNQAGPRDPTTGFPLGGAALFLNNFEIRFPPPTLPFVQDNMSFAVFHDMGNVFTDGRHMLNSLLRWKQDTSRCSQGLNTSFQSGAGAALCNYNYISHAIGIGVRYKTPVGPVRFDFGYNLNPTVYPGFVDVTDSMGNIIDHTFAGTRQASPFNVYFSIGQTF